jgi:precorrin-6B methylase 2
MRSLIRAYRKVAPEWFRDRLFDIRLRQKQLKRDDHSMRLQALSYLNSHDDIEAKNDIITFLENNPITTFPYADLQKAGDVTIQKDPNNGLYFGLVNGKRMYMKRQSTAKANKEYIEGLMCEQLPMSPHRYITSDFHPDHHSILVDVGAAEGNFSLEMVDTVKHIYLFETDPDWIEALQHTFAPWKHKVDIIQAMVSDTDGEGHLTLDTFFRQKTAPPDFIKLDVEGGELEVLKGAQSIIQSSTSLKVAACTYHRKDDATDYQHFFEQQGFNVEFSDRYMFFLEDYQQFSPPYVRKGLIRATLLPQ